MFKLIVLCAAVCLVTAVVEVDRRSEEVRADGFDAEVSLNDGSSRQESGDVHGNIKGSFEWISPEGEHVRLEYVADENGYQPKGSVLPTPPPIPEAIVRALKWIENNPHEE